eukprot:4184258-Prorocentrum_lima.AAC.1
MTSSLVGSEMCIRDSASAVAVSFFVSLVVVVFAAERHGHEAMQRVSLAPVSYTHLTLPTICSV